jgi:hypothetical protein
MTTGKTRAFGYFACLLILLLFCPFLHAQKNDSSNIYKKLKHFAYKRKLTRMAYDAFFTEPKPIEYPVQPATKQEGKVINPYLKYENRVIRSITISVFDPFGCTINDTICKPLKYYERMGNRFHMRTKKWIVNNKLLFKEHDKLNPLSVSESERLLRQSPFANDARILVNEVNNDTVDVHVIVLDKWSITVPADASPQSANVRYRDNNLFGLGNQFEQYVHYTRPDVFNYSGYYLMNNIDNTYISSRLAYAYDPGGTSVGLSFDRPFYSPLAKWAGGLYTYHTQRFYPYVDPETNRSRDLNLVNVGVDMWAGKSIKLDKVKSFFNQSTNIIMAQRYYSNTYIKRPEEAITALKGLDNESGVIGAVGYAIQEYYKDKYIYRFGANEDVPQGFILQFLYGAQKKEFTQIRYYAGGQIARAKHSDIGYLSASLSYGIFFNHYYTNDITTNLKLYYFSDLLKKGSWYFRQFFNYNLVHGEHKLFNEMTTITSSDLYGFNSTPLMGHTKMVFNSETVAYMPYNVIGFKFAPVFSMGFGMLGRDQQKLLNSDIYQAYTLGIMMRNENLLNSTFQVSFGLYPYFPNGGTYILKYNPVTSFTLRVLVFSIARPDFIPY